VTRPEVKLAKADAQKVRVILNEDWQPIPGVPEDEWDSYLWPVLGLLKRGAPREEVKSYLRRTAEETIGMPLAEPSLERVVDKLIALGLENKTPPA
jgi:hypothetical protein